MLGGAGLVGLALLVARHPPRRGRRSCTAIVAPVSTTVPSDIRDLGLAPEGVMRVEWADRQMPVLAAIRERFAAERPLAGLRVSACLHVTSETANLARTLKAGGADVVLCASNPLSTQDDVAAALVAEYGIAGLRDQGRGRTTSTTATSAPRSTTGRTSPWTTAADVVSTLHKERQDMLGDVIGGTEETTTGVIRLRAMERDGVLGFPVIAVNDAKTKHFFDNRYGTGQSTIDGIIRATNMLLAGRTFVVCGYGWCGRGVADAGPRAWAPTSIVIEVDPMRALEAVMDGFRVMPIAEAAHAGRHLRHRHRQQARDPARALRGDEGRRHDLQLRPLQRRDRHPGAARARHRRPRGARRSSSEFDMADGARIYLLAEGRLVNLAAAEGHPASSWT